jgi:hypothetical protein
MDNKTRPENLKDYIHIILNGNTEECKAIAQKFFYLADTPQFMKNLGLTGEYFSIRYGVISRHKNKDSDHNLTEKDWNTLCDKIIEPFAIGTYKNGFRLYFNMKIHNHWAAIGIDVKNINKNLEINAVKTVFGIKKANIDNIIYVSEKITPEQTALLGKHNSFSYPSVQ